MHRYMGEDSFFVKREYKEWNKIEIEILSKHSYFWKVLALYLILIVEEK